MPQGVSPENAPSVSVIVPTFNRMGLLKEAVGAILNQTFDDFELIIIDNLSTDGTEAFVGDIGDSRISCCRNPNNGVIAVSRNLGIRRSAGKLVAFCDDDDIWAPDKLEAQVAFMEDNPDVSLSYGYALDFGTPEALRLHYPAWESRSAASFEALFAKGNKIVTSTVMVRKGALDRSGLFDEDPRFRAIEDYDLWLRLARDGRVACMPRVLCRYRVHGGAMTRDPYKENLKLLMLIGKFRENRWADETLLRKAEANVSRMLGNAALLIGEAGYRGWYVNAFRLHKSPGTFFPLAFALMPRGIAGRLFALLKKGKAKGF